MTQAKILIVEDEFIVARDLQSHLEELGYQVCGRVNSGRKAIEHVQTNETDLVLMDIILKGEMNGIEAAAVIHSQFHLPVIYLSANANPQFVEQAKLTEPFGYIIKPFNEQALYANIEMSLYKYRMEVKLRESENTLRSLNEELEKRVEARTRELRESNTTLVASLEALQNIQEQLVQSEKMAALGRLVSAVSHEIKTPLGLGITATSYIEQITEDLTKRYWQGAMKRSELERYLKTVRESAYMIRQNLQHAVDQIQSFSRMAIDQELDEKKTFLLKPYLEDIILSLQPQLRKTQHLIILNCPEDLELESYPAVFVQIVRNFVLNSLLHGFENMEKGLMKLDVSRHTSSLLLWYRDNGRGMSEKERERIFGPFYTTKRDQGGSGLGLHIVYTLVTQRLQGQISCESIPGGGTIFTVSIPLE